jgi:hypothetical protein
MPLNVWSTAQSQTALFVVPFPHVYHAIADIHYQLILLLVLFNAIFSIVHNVLNKINAIVVMADTLSSITLVC